MLINKKKRVANILKGELDELKPNEVVQATPIVPRRPVSNRCTLGENCRCKLDDFGVCPREGDNRINAELDDTRAELDVPVRKRGHLVAENKRGERDGRTSLPLRLRLCLPIA